MQDTVTPRRPGLALGLILGALLAITLCPAAAFAEGTDDRKNQLKELGIIKADQCDTDCDGTLTIDELEAVGLSGTLPAGIRIDQVDTDGDGMISQEELDAYYTSEQVRKDEKRKYLQDKARQSKSPKIHF
ncbi:EF-hand domain-containing protein [Salidesulfovibrio brasiliensis]